MLQTHGKLEVLVKMFRTYACVTDGIARLLIKATVVTEEIDDAHHAR